MVPPPSRILSPSQGRGLSWEQEAIARIDKGIARNAVDPQIPIDVIADIDVLPRRAECDALRDGTCLGPGRDADTLCRKGQQRNRTILCIPWTSV